MTTATERKAKRIARAKRQEKWDMLKRLAGNFFKFMGVMSIVMTFEIVMYEISIQNPMRVLEIILAIEGFFLALILCGIVFGKD